MLIVSTARHIALKKKPEWAKEFGSKSADSLRVSQKKSFNGIVIAVLSIFVFAPIVLTFGVGAIGSGTVSSVAVSAYVLLLGAASSYLVFRAIRHAELRNAIDRQKQTENNDGE